MEVSRVIINLDKINYETVGIVFVYIILLTYICKKYNNMIGIYKIENLITNKIYIGSSKNINERFINHKSMLKNNTHHCVYLQRAINKYGINNFSFEIVEQCSIEDLVIKEQYYIDLHKNNLYNMLLIANPGFNQKHKKESLIKSQRARGFSSILKIDIKGNILKEYDLISEIEFKPDRIYKSIKNQNCIKSYDFGFIYSKDYYVGYKPKSLSNWNKNIKYKQNNIKSYPIYVYDTYGRFYKKFNSLRDCAIEMSIPTSNLHRILNNENVRNRNYLFFTEEKTFNNLLKLKTISDTNNQIVVHDVFNNLIGYSNLKELSLLLNCNKNSINDVIIGKREKCYNYKFSKL